MGEQNGNQAATTTADQDTPPPVLTHRRNRLAGIWAAELLGLIGHAAGDYAKTVVHPGHTPEKMHDDDADMVVDKLSHDLDGRVSLTEIREKMSHFLHEAKRQMRHEKRD
jgi:hypothetical protein